MNGQLTNTTGDSPYANPTVKLLIFGVGILWFDEKQNCADFGFVPVPNNPHPLFIEVCEEGKVIYSERLGKGSKILINGNSQNRGMGRRYQPFGSKPPKDFSWMLDLDKIHDSPLDFKSEPDFFARLRMSIGDAIFYTAKLSNSNGQLQNSSGLSVGNPNLIGQIVGLVTKDKEIQLTVNDDTDILKPDKNYTIIIRYHCIKGKSGTASDFKHIYDVLETNEKFDLNYEGYEGVPVFSCEMAKIKAIGLRLAETDFDDEVFTREKRDQLIDDLEYLNFKISCDVACQNPIFGEFSRSVVLK